MLRVRSRRIDAPVLSNTHPLGRTLPPVPFPRTFYSEPSPVPEADIKFRTLSSGVLSVLNRFRRVRNNNLTREQWQGFREIRQLSCNGAIRISVSDKGGEFVVIPQPLDREITELHLRDTSTYQHATAMDFLSQCKRLNHVWMTVGKSAGLSERFLRMLRLDNPSCPVFYSLIKTHKIAAQDISSTSADTYKIRPIISCVGRPTDRISWFLDAIVSQLLTKIPSHLSNTSQFLERLRNSHFSVSWRWSHLM